MPVKVGEVRMIKNNGLPAFNKEIGNCSVLAGTKVIIKEVNKARWLAQVHFLLPNGVACQSNYEVMFANSTRL